jgi:hypothetical protein
MDKRALSYQRGESSQKRNSDITLQQCEKVEKVNKNIERARDFV